MVEKKDALVQAIMFRDRLMTVGEIYQTYGRRCGLGYQTIRKRIAAGDRGESILRPPQMSEKRRQYLIDHNTVLKAEQDRGQEAAAKAQAKIDAVEIPERAERMRRLAMFLNPRKGMT